MTPLEAAYESAKNRMSMGYEEFANAVADYEVRPIEVDGELCGAVLIKGPEIHACIQPKGFGRWITRSRLRDILGAVIERHGHATTSVAVGNEIGKRFVERLGFKYQDTVGASMRYRLEA